MRLSETGKVDGAAKMLSAEVDTSGMLPFTGKTATIFWINGGEAAQHSIELPMEFLEAIVHLTK